MKVFGHKPTPSAWFGLVVVGVYRAGLQHGRAERDAAVAELKAACLADQRDVAIRSADAYGAALTAQRQRTVAAQRAESGAQVRLSAAVEIIAAKVREVEHARAYVPDLCFPDDLRLRIDAVADAIDGRLAPDRSPPNPPAAGLSRPVRFDPAGSRRREPRAMDRPDTVGVWCLRSPADRVRCGATPARG